VVSEDEHQRDDEREHQSSSPPLLNREGKWEHVSTVHGNA